MKKLIVVVAVLAGIGYLAKRFGPKLGDVDWEKRFAAMPETRRRSGCSATSQRSATTPNASSNYSTRAVPRNWQRAASRRDAT